jgi:hypothetical protein
MGIQTVRSAMLASADEGVNPASRLFPSALHQSWGRPIQNSPVSDEFDGGGWLNLSRHADPNYSLTDPVIPET